MSELRAPRRGKEVERVLHLLLNEQETEALRKSAAVLRGVLDELEDV